jgi:hypothetical protein
MRLAECAGMHGLSAEAPPIWCKPSTTFGSTLFLSPLLSRNRRVALALCAEPSRIEQGRTQFGRPLTRRRGVMTTVRNRKKLWCASSCNSSRGRVTRKSSTVIPPTGSGDAPGSANSMKRWSSSGSNVIIQTPVSSPASERVSSAGGSPVLSRRFIRPTSDVDR